MTIFQLVKSAWSALRADAGGGLQLSPDSDFWYRSLGVQTASGLRVSPESAMRVAAVYACVRVIAETVASLPLIIYRELPDGGKERATDHPLYELLHDEPNSVQTSYEFMEMMQGHLELRGNSYARIISGEDGAIQELIPLHPDRVDVFRMPDRSLNYRVRSLYSTETLWLNQAEMLHFRGLSSDGLVGMSTIAVGAEAIGCGLAAQEFAARFFENDSTPSGVMIHPKTLTETAHSRITKSWREQHSGTKQHSLALLEEGMTYQNIGLTNTEAQLIEARQFSRGDIASVFRVPPHKIGDLSRATFSNIEQQNIEFATDCIRPRLVRLERRLNTSLIEPLDLEDTDTYFCEFEMDALMRGDLKSRYEAYSTGINAGFLIRNEARQKENLNPVPGLDKPLAPLNLAPVDSNGVPIQPSSGEDATGTGALRLKQFVQAAAERTVRRELKELRRIEASSNGDFRSCVEDFYSGFYWHVVSSLRIDAANAMKYVNHNRDMVVADRTQGINAIERGAAEWLCEIALKERL